MKSKDKLITNETEEYDSIQLSKITSSMIKLHNRLYDIQISAMNKIDTIVGSLGSRTLSCDDENNDGTFIANMDYIIKSMWLFAENISMDIDRL
jgi:hypothetical protein